MFLDLSDNHLCGRDVDALVGAIVGSSIRVVKLASNNLRDDGAQVCEELVLG